MAVKTQGVTGLVHGKRLELGEFQFTVVFVPPAV
jgi:hypothetical protein